MKTKTKTIVTKRLTLAPIDDKHKEEAILLFNDPLVKKTYMIPDFANKEQEDVFFNKIRDLTHSDSHYSYGIFLNDELIGFINDVCIENDTIEVGYFIRSDQWNNGFATEALSAMIKELCAKEFTVVHSAHFENNLASGRVMQKCGMKLIDKEEIVEYRGEKHRCIYYEIRKNS